MLAAMTQALPRFIAGLTVLAVTGLGLPAGCGGSSGSGPPTDAGGGGGGGTITLTSSAFVEGGAIPVTHTCKDANTSPPLAWTGAPGGAQSFAVVLTDLSLSPHLIHWAIFDISAATTELPADIQKVYAPSNVPGAHQVSFRAQTQGYQGPCPPNQHTYELAAYALDVATLPGATMQNTPADIVAAINMHRLASGTLTGTFTP
jgi:Raf kinase inhibitor-like YbhB/YbcL family protein